MPIESTDRYEALGIPQPDPATVCLGQCEGTGVYPQHQDDITMTPDEQTAWDACEAENPADDGWHFISCSACGGTGKRAKSD